MAQPTPADFLAIVEVQIGSGREPNVSNSPHVREGDVFGSETASTNLSAYRGSFRTTLVVRNRREQVATQAVWLLWPRV